MDASPPASATAPRHLLRLLLVGAACVLANRLGYQFTMAGEASMIWPPAGVNLAAVLLFGYRVWPAIAAASVLGFLLRGAPMGFVIADAIGNTLEPLLGAYLLRRWGFRYAMDRVRDVFFLALGPAIPAVAVSALIGTTALSALGMQPWSAWGMTGLTWWLGDAVGILVLTPLLIVWTRPRAQAPAGSTPEALALSVALVVVGLSSFGAPHVVAGYDNALAFLAVPVLIWAAVRYGPRGAVAATALVVATSVLSSSLHFGPHDPAQDGASLLLVWLFAVVCALTALVVGAAVAERDRVRAELEVSRARFRDRYLKTPVMLHSTDADGRVVAVSDAWAAKMGFPRSEVLGRALADFLDEPSRQAFARSVVAEAAPDEVRDLPLRFVARGGEVFETRLSSTREAGPEGRDRQSLAVVVDVTRRIRAEASLARARFTLDQARDLVLWLGLDGRVVDANPAAIEVFGGFGPDWRARGVGELFDDLADDVWRTLERRARAGEHVSLELMARRLEGGSFPVEVDLSSFELSGEQLVCLFARDLSARRALEERLRQSQKLLAIGTLAGGVAHDFNNILAIILANVSLARRIAPDDEDLQACLGDVAVATQRGARLVRQILTFARKKEVTREPIKVQDVLAEVAAMLRAVLPATVSLNVALDAPDVAVEADATELHQVFMNLCTNAAQAMARGGGVLAVQLARVELDEDAARRYPSLQPGSYVRVTVADTGEGIPPTAIDRIFEPFFTTKPVGEGTGMGLAVVHGVITALGGAVMVRSQVGLGTAFDVLLPSVAAAERAEPQAPAGVG